MMTVMNKERELTSPVNLCDEQGKLNHESIGWARKPIITSNLKGHYFRKKRWNYWCVFGQEALFSATVSHLDYALVCFVYYLEYETKEFYERTIVIPFGNSYKMPDTVLGSVEAINEDMGIFFFWDGRHIHLKISTDNFGGETLHADIKITYREEVESLNVVIPWSDEKFQFTSKQQCLPAEGKFTVGNKTFTFHKETDSAVLDYGRGDWPRNISWNWGMASGWQGKDSIGINFGSKWTDGTGVTENAFLLNGKLTKVHEPVEFLFFPDNMMKEWEIRSTETDQVRLTFTPFFKRKSKTNLMIVKSEMVQLFGHYNGTMKKSNGETVKVVKLLGSIEDHIAKW